MAKIYLTPSECDHFREMFESCGHEVIESTMLVGGIAGRINGIELRKSLTMPTLNNLIVSKKVKVNTKRKRNPNRWR